MLKVTSRTSKADIVNYAATELGVKLDESKNKDDLVAEVRALEIEMGIAQDNEPVQHDKDAEQEETKAEAGKIPTRAVILIHQPPSPDEESEPDTHCIIGLNGRNYQIAYGDEVEVPYGVYDILKNAKQVRYFTKKDPATGMTQTESKVVQRYPFSLIRFIY